MMKWMSLALALIMAISVQAGYVFNGLSDEEADTLIFMREEEKLARDVYLTLYEVWGAAVFKNIAASEQKHMDNMKNLIDRYQLVDPVIDDQIGLFQNPDFTALYQQLTEQGQDSLEQALLVGALIEEIDINDLINAIDEAQARDLIRSYQDLMRGSRNHLRAFVSQLESMGMVYEAQVMDQEAVDAIVNTPIERGGRGKRPLVLTR